MLTRERQMTSPVSEPALEPLRSNVLEVLEHFWWPLSPTNELQPIIETWQASSIDPNALKRLLEAEKQAFTSGAERDVWVCLGIRPDLQGDPNRWARSDWPKWVRVIDPESERIRAYWLLRQLYRFWISPDNPRAERLRDLWSNLAEELPASEVRQLRRIVESHKQNFDWAVDRFPTWAEVADELFGRAAEKDRVRRQAIAEELVGLDPRIQLFGVNWGE